VSGTFCEELALRVLRTKGTGHLFPAHCLIMRSHRFQIVGKPMADRLISHLIFIVRTLVQSGLSLFFQPIGH